MRRSPVTALRMGAIVVDGVDQLPLPIGVGGAGKNGEQGKQAQRRKAQGNGGLAHGTGNSDEMTIIGVGGSAGYDWCLDTRFTADKRRPVVQPRRATKGKEWCVV